jgi:hypothetical protein
MTLLMATTVSTVWGLSDIPIADRLNISSGTAWRPGVESIIQIGNTVYFAGAFSSVTGIARNKAAAFDSTTGNVLNWNVTNPNQRYESFKSLAISNDKNHIFIGSEEYIFRSVNPISGDIQWQTDLLREIGEPRISVNAIGVDGNVVYIGGGFGYVQNKLRNNLARLNASTGVLDESWAPNPNDSVLSFIVFNGKVYVGGQFSQIGGKSRNGIARFDVQTGNLDDWDPKLGNYSSVNSMVVRKGILYIGGNFNNVGTETRNKLASFDLETGNLTPWAPDIPWVSFTPEIYAVADGKDGKIYVGGRFERINNTNRKNLAAVDAITGELDSWNPNPNLAVGTIFRGDSYLMVGGGFTSMGTASGPAYLAEFEFPPLPPNSGSIVSVSATSLMSQWTASTNATSYQLIASTINVNPPTSITGSATVATTNGTVTGLVTGMRYYMFVNACNGGGCSDYSFLGSAVASGSVDTMRAYPNPFRPGRGVDGMTFDQMPEGATVKVYTMKGELVKTLSADSDTFVWDVKSDGGDPVASGVYIVVAKGNGGQKVFKIVVQR